MGNCYRAARSFPLIVLRLQALSLLRLRSKSLLLPLYPAILSPSHSLSFQHTHPFCSSFIWLHSLLPRYLIPLRNCIPSIVKPRPAPTESSRDASLSTSRFNCLSMPDDAFSARAIPSERPRERHRFFRKRIRPRLIIDSHSPALDCPEKRNVPVVETPFTDKYVPARTRSLCSLARNIFHATRAQ